MMNQRGTDYSRGHTSLDAETSKTYWDMTLTEQWLDIKANIEIIKAYIGYNELYYVGYSGATS